MQLISFPVTNRIIVTNDCIKCAAPIDPYSERHEITYDDSGMPRRLCGECIRWLEKTTSRMAVSTTTGHRDPRLHA